MLKVILGEKGTGKTAQLIASVNEAMEHEKGAVVFITNSDRHTYDLKSSIRLVVANEYGIDNYEKFYGFVGGILSQNFDITNIFIDGTFRIVGGKDPEAVAEFLDKVNALAGDHVTVTITLSIDPEKVGDGVKKYA